MEEETPYYVDISEDIVITDPNEGTDYDPNKIPVEVDSPDPYIDRKYLIVNTSDLFGEEYDNYRKNNSETKMVVGWNGDIPELLSSLTDTEGPYTREEIKTIMLTTEWVEIMEEN
jgi:hypothetical protein